MTEFKRENRYLVIKRDDTYKYLTEQQQIWLGSINNSINTGRITDDKPVIECVLAKKGQPEYEIVWKMIEERFINDNKQGE